MLPWKLRKRHILPVNQNLLSIYVSLAKFQLVSCNLSLAIIWQTFYFYRIVNDENFKMEVEQTNFMTHFIITVQLYY